MELSLQRQGMCLRFVSTGPPGPCHYNLGVCFKLSSLFLLFKIRLDHRLRIYKHLFFDGHPWWLWRDGSWWINLRLLFQTPWSSSSSFPDLVTTLKLFTLSILGKVCFIKIIRRFIYFSSGHTCCRRSACTLHIKFGIPTARRKFQNFPSLLRSPWSYSWLQISSTVKWSNSSWDRPKPVKPLRAGTWAPFFFTWLTFWSVVTEDIDNNLHVRRKLNIFW